MQKPQKIKKENISKIISIDYDLSASVLVNVITDLIAKIKKQAEKEFNKKIRGKDIIVQIINKGYYGEDDYYLELSVFFEIDNPNYEYEMKKYSEYIDKVLEDTKETRAWLDREEEAGKRNYDRWK
ncbi:MAG TPA: hypothetical protein VMX17_07715 [Candidatus Glassbacteria bacterium]|nr:hypothetical protein [Candidatus Glassbacteria bacterium]